MAHLVCEVGYHAFTLAMLRRRNRRMGPSGPIIPYGVVLILMKPHFVDLDTICPGTRTIMTSFPRRCRPALFKLVTQPYAEARCITKVNKMIRMILMAHCRRHHSAVLVVFDLLSLTWFASLRQC
jgi:hypothetical protein